MLKRELFNVTKVKSKQFYTAGFALETVARNASNYLELNLETGEGIADHWSESPPTKLLVNSFVRN